MDATQGLATTDGRNKVLAAICLSAVIIPLVFTGPAISTPAVGRDLGGDQASLGWIVNAYAITFGGCVMAAGALGDQIGRKRCFVVGLAIFTVTSILIGLTPSLLLLNLLRAVEGIGGALVLTSATSLLAQEFEEVERPRAFSFLGTAFGVGLAFGPMAAGFVIEHWGWRSLYFGIAAISLLVLTLGTPRIRESRDPDAKGIDWWGTVLFTAALVSFTFSVVLGPQDGWASLRVIGLFAGSAASLAAFVLVELQQVRPMLDLSLFRYPRFIGVQLLPIATGFSFIALIVYLPIWFIAAQGRDEFAAGLAILPLTTPMLIVPLLAGALAKWIAPGILSGVGFLISASGALLLMRLSPEGGVGPMILPMLLIGVGNGLPWGLMDALSVSVVPKERAGMASGIFTTSRVAGEAIAIAAIGAALIGLTGHNLATASTDKGIALPASAAEIAAGVGAGGQINAVVRVRHSPVLHFIASAMARGGFSGGAALDQSGTALALVTESLGQGDMPVGTGYMSLLSIEPAVDLAAEKFGFSTHGGYPGRYSDTLFAAKFSNPSSDSLSSFIYDASLYVYDDDHDLFVEINCADEPLLAEAVATYHAITPVKRVDVDDGSVLYIPEENPPAKLLLEAGEAVAALFERSGYRRMASERSQWQLKPKY